MATTMIRLRSSSRCSRRVMRRRRRVIGAGARHVTGVAATAVGGRARLSGLAVECRRRVGRSSEAVRALRCRREPTPRGRSTPGGTLGPLADGVADVRQLAGSEDDQHDHEQQDELGQRMGIRHSDHEPPLLARVAAAGLASVAPHRPCDRASALAAAARRLRPIRRRRTRRRWRARRSRAPARHARPRHAHRRVQVAALRPDARAPGSRGRARAAHGDSSSSGRGGADHQPDAAVRPAGGDPCAPRATCSGLAVARRRSWSVPAHGLLVRART